MVVTNCLIILQWSPIKNQSLLVKGYSKLLKYLSLQFCYRLCLFYLNRYTLFVNLNLFVSVHVLVCSSLDLVCFFSRFLAASNYFRSKRGAFLQRRVLDSGNMDLEQRGETKRLSTTHVGVCICFPGFRSLVIVLFQQLVKIVNFIFMPSSVIQLNRFRPFPDSLYLAGSPLSV